MAFLDNSGDIILDAVLTDTGRLRLAQGNGSFKIVKFALGDDEINYELYNSSHSNGSAYYDLEILRTPVLEAFTNNASSMKSRLISYSSDNLLYLPTLQLNELVDANKKHSTGVFLVAVNKETQTDLAGTTGLLHGFTPSDSTSNSVLLHQGLDTTAIAASIPIGDVSSDIQETEFMFEMDNRLGTLTDLAGNNREHSYIDDDQMAAYLVSKTEASANSNNIVTALQPAGDTDSAADIANTTPIAGPRDVRVSFKLKAKIDLTNSEYLFTTLGTTGVRADAASLNVTSASGVAQTFRFIDSSLRINGTTTGTIIDIPIRYIKKE